MEYIKLKLKDKSAQDMIEFTFVLPLLIFCFVFILTGGQLIYNKFVAFNAAYNGLRQASTARNGIEAYRVMDSTAKEYSAQTISVDSYHVKLQDSRGHIISSLYGSLFMTWNKDDEIMGEVKYIVNTVFPFRFNFKSSFNGTNVDTEFLAPNQMEISAITKTYVEYDNNSYEGTKTW